MQLTGVAVPMASIVAGPRALCDSLIPSKYAISLGSGGLKLSISQTKKYYW